MGRHRSPELSRRRLLQNLGASVVALSLPGCATRVDQRVQFRTDPFMLGVASGYPQPDAVVLWTRLLPDQDGQDGPLPPSGIPVDWEIAADEQFTRVVRRGHMMALPELGHSVHVDCRGLGAGREYWYRFVAGGVRSPAGRTATAPPSDALPGRLRVALASCQHYEHGFYGAYRHMVADQPDLVLHVGDYIYETAAGNRGVRSHGTAECQTLDDYRARYALYRSDPDLQRAHASCPWLVTWDDHEVDNDYASDLPEDGGDPATFLLRRAAAYQAFYEHMPLPPAALLAPGEVSLYCERRWGRLASLWMLDTRQYRAPHACPKPGRRGGNRVSNCAELAQPGRHKLGEVQENWLGRRLEASDARWNLLAQGTLMTYVDEDPGQTETFWTDSWNGYPWARQRLLDLLARGVSNPVVLSGDSHAFVVGDLNAVPADPASPIVASEFVTTSISSNGLPQSWVDEWFAPNPNVHLARSDVRGYVRLDVEREGIAIDLIAMESVAERSSAARVLASYRVADGLPGPVAA